MVNDIRSKFNSFEIYVYLNIGHEQKLSLETGQGVPVSYGGSIMGSSHSSLEEHLLCCSQKYTIYDDRQLAALTSYKEQLGLDKKQL